MLRDLMAQADALLDRMRAERLESQPALAERALHIQLCEVENRFAALLGHVKEPLIALVELALAAQAAVGDAPDALLAICLALHDKRLLDVGARIRERMAALPAEVARLEREYGPELLVPPVGT